MGGVISDNCRFSIRNPIAITAVIAALNSVTTSAFLSGQRAVKLEMSEVRGGGTPRN